MAHKRRNRKPEGAATPPPETNLNHLNEPFDSPKGKSPASQGLGNQGALSVAEVVVASLVVAILLVAGLMTLRVTEKGTVSQQKQQQAMDLAKGMSEQLKSYLNSQNWNEMKIDVRFPATQTPAVASYNAYAPQTVVEKGGSGAATYILDPEVRYVVSNSSNDLEYIPTPGTASTPEVGNLLRIRVDCFYGPLSEFIPVATALPVRNTLNRVVYTNLLSNKTIYVGSTGSISGFVFINCTASTPSGPGIVVGLFQGALLYKSVVTDTNSYFEFDNIQQGTYMLETTSSPGYDPYSGYSCGVAEPVTLTAGTDLSLQNIGIVPLPVVNYWGVVVKTTPVVTTVPPPGLTPTPNPTAVFNAAPVSNVIVFSDDGNSSPVTSALNGGYTIFSVRATPNGGRTFDTIEGDYLAASPPTPVLGKNYNPRPDIYPSTVIAGIPWVGPITIYLQSVVTNNQAVTFVVLDADKGTGFPVTNYAVTVYAADGSASPPSKGTTVAGQTSVTMSVNQGVPNISVSMAGNNPPFYQTFNSALVVDNTVNAPLTLLNYAVGSGVGTVCGMGASFDYTQFTVRATDSFTGQYVYDIPVVYDGASTFGTFSFSYLRTPEGTQGAAQEDYNFTANGSGNFSSNQYIQTIYQGKSTTLGGPLVVVPLNVYMAVTVTYNSNGTSYPYGAWISAVMVPAGQTPVPVPTAGQGAGYGVQDYYSGITKGDGTASIQIQLSGGVSTVYQVTAQITNPTSFAVTQKSQFITVGAGDTQASPHSVSIGF